MIQEDKPESTWYQRMVKLVQDRPEDYPDYVYENQLLYRHIGSRPDDEDSVPWKLCVAKEHRQRVLAECHDQPTAGHLGIRKTTARIAQRYYWPGLFRDISSALAASSQPATSNSSPWRLEGSSQRARNTESGAQPTGSRRRHTDYGASLAIEER
nr:uncharacterized protein LOC121502828 [Drosophila kikkawai]